MDLDKWFRFSVKSLEYLRGTNGLCGCEMGTTFIIFIRPRITRQLWHGQSPHIKTCEWVHSSVYSGFSHKTCTQQVIVYLSSEILDEHRTFLNKYLLIANSPHVIQNPFFSSTTDITPCKTLLMALQQCQEIPTYEVMILLS